MRREALENAARATMLDLVSGASERHPDKIAVAEGGRSVIFRDFGAMVAERVDLLRVSVPGPVAVILPSGASALAWWLASFSSGRTVALLDHALATAPLSEHLRLLRPSLAVRRRGDDEHEELVGCADVERRRSSGDLLSGRVVVFTAGTTGVPKAVVHTPISLLWSMWVSSAYSARALGEELRLPTDEDLPTMMRAGDVPFFAELVFLAAMPLSSISGLTVALRAVMWGSTLVSVPRLHAAEVLRAVPRYAVTNLALTPFMAQSVLRLQRRARHDTRSLVAIGIGSAGVPPGLCAAIEGALDAPVAIGYGTTETCGQAFMSDFADPEHLRWNTIGAPVPGCAAVVAEAGARAPWNESRDGAGELLLRHPSQCAGYLQVDGSLCSALAEDRWYHTGDLARTASDEQALVLVGRRSEMIVRGGRNIDPSAIERVIEQYDGVDRAAVVGAPSAVAGEEDICAAITVVDGARVDTDALRAMCVDTLGALLAPRRIRVVEDFDLASDFSIRRHAVRERYFPSVPDVLARDT